MKRIASLITASLLLLPASAGAGETTYRGLAAGEPSVSFTAKLRDDDPVKVTKFKFFNILLDCNEGQILVDNDRSPLPAMKVEDNRFGDRFTTTNGQAVKVSGKFTNKGRKAEGTLRVQGDFVASDGALLTGCDSGKVRWVTGT
jgi:hypothetical protein